MKQLAVFLNIFAGIPFGESDVEHFAAVESADSALRSAETVNQPRERGECRDLKKAYTDCRGAEFTSVPGGSGLFLGAGVLDRVFVFAGVI